MSAASIAVGQDVQQAAANAALKKCLTDNPVGLPPFGKSLAEVEQTCHFTAQQGDRDVIVKNQSGLVLKDTWSNNGFKTSSGPFTVGFNDEQRLDGSRRNEVYITWHNFTEKVDDWPIVGTFPPSLVDGPCHIVIPKGPGKTVITVTGVASAPNQKCTVQ